MPPIRLFRFHITTQPEQKQDQWRKPQEALLKCGDPQNQNLWINSSRSPEKQGSDPIQEQRFRCAAERAGGSLYDKAFYSAIMDTGTRVTDTASPLLYTVATATAAYSPASSGRSRSNSASASPGLSTSERSSASPSSSRLMITALPLMVLLV